MGKISNHGTGERGRWFYNDKGELQKKPPKKQLKPIHAVIQDTRLDPIECMCGCDQLFDSMSAYKKHLKEGGWEITGHIPRGPETSRASDRFRELIGDDERFKEDFERSRQLVEWGMMPRTADERAEYEAQENEQKAQEEAWKRRNWHRK